MHYSNKSIKETSKKSDFRYSFSARPSKLQEFFVESLRDIYLAEKKSQKALPKMDKAATSSELVAAFEEYLNVIEEQVAHLDKDNQKITLPKFAII